MTGQANRLISAIVGVSGNSMLLGLFLTMICCIVLGMGVPTTATYCIMASTCAPILIQMGVPQIAAHFFVFYYGIVADITPPVALAAYAGAAIAKGKPMKTYPSLEAGLDALFSGSGIDYEIMKKYIVLTKAGSKKKPKDYTIFIEEQHDTINESVITALIDPKRNSTQTGLKSCC